MTDDFVCHLTYTDQDTWVLQEFIEKIADDLYLTHSYFSTIAVVLNECYEYLSERKHWEQAQLSYHTEKGCVVFTFRGINHKAENIKSLKNKEIQPVSSKSLVLSSTLAHKVVFQHDQLMIALNIEGLHQKLMNSRKHVLKAYFAKKTISSPDV